MKTLRKLAGALALASFSAAGFAQYPTKPVRLVVPFAAGGPTDAIARTMGRALAQSMGQPFVVENRPGAEGLIAGQVVFNAPPDGYTLYVAGSSASAGLAALRKDVPFDSREFTPIANIATITFCLLTAKDLPVRNVGELVRHAKANPGQLNYAIAANSEFMAAAQLMKATGTQMVKVPYKGSAQAIPELVAGRVQVYFAPLSPERLAYAADGRLRMLGIASAQRSRFAPDVPTLAEAGVQGIAVPGWNALLGPPKLPAEIVQKLSREVAKALQDPEVRATLDRLMLEAGASTPEELGATMRADFQLWSDFVREYDVARE